MSKTVCEVHIIGNVGRDAERYGNGPVKFSVATGGGTNQKTGKTYPVDWHQVSVWDVAYLERIKKGCQVELIGRLGYEIWDDKKTGEKKTKAVITANRIEILGEQSLPSSDRHDFARQPTREEADTYIGDEDSIPF